MDKIQPVSTQRKSLLRAALLGGAIGVLDLALAFALLGTGTEAFAGLHYLTQSNAGVLLAWLICIPAVVVGYPLLHVVSGIQSASIGIPVFTILFVLVWAGVFAVVRLATLRLSQRHARIVHAVLAALVYVCGFFFVKSIAQ